MMTATCTVCEAGSTTNAALRVELLICGTAWSLR